MSVDSGGDGITAERTLATVSLARCRSYDRDAVNNAIVECLRPLGGMAAFVSPGQRVLLKPNFLSAKPPEAAVTTHPEVLRAVATEVRKAGGVICLGDSPGFGSLTTLLKRTGVGAVVEEMGIKVVPFLTPSKRAVPAGGVYRALELSNEALSFDVVVNLPKLKTHGQMTLTLGVKNLFGLVVGLAKPAWHLKAGDERGMADLLLDIWRAAPPALTVLDGIVSMEGNGPGAGGDPRKTGLLAASPSALALDAVVADLLGVGPKLNPVVNRAIARGLRDADLGNIRLAGLSREDARIRDFRLPESAARVDYDMPRWVKKPLRRTMSSFPVIDPVKCTTCDLCAKTCPVSAITLVKDSGGTVDRNLCISCMCCQELCPEGAVKPVPGRLLRVLKGLGVA